jgi:hypothetical protein
MAAVKELEECGLANFVFSRFLRLLCFFTSALLFKPKLFVVGRLLGHSGAVFIMIEEGVGVDAGHVWQKYERDVLGAVLSERCFRQRCIRRLGLGGYFVIQIASRLTHLNYLIIRIRYVVSSQSTDVAVAS